jgi:hypothetical protein
VTSPVGWSRIRPLLQVAFSEPLHSQTGTPTGAAVSCERLMTPLLLVVVRGGGAEVGSEGEAETSGLAVVAWGLAEADAALRSG